MKTTLRPATKDDFYDLYLWRNDPVTVANSTNAHSVSFKDHEQWFLRTLNSDACALLIGRAGRVGKIGVIRFDAQQADWWGDESWMVSITIAPECRGKGYGKRLLRHGCHFMGDDKTFFATIKWTNTPSIKTFTGCGFKRYSEIGKNFWLYRRGIRVAEG